MDARLLNEKYIPWLVAGIIAIIILVVTESIVFLSSERHIEHQKADVTSQLASIRARIEGEINSTLHLTRGLIAYVAVNPDLSVKQFEQIASEIIFLSKHIRNIALAPNNILSYVFPLVGNEKALGLEYEKNKAQWPAVKRAIDMHSTIVAGPVNLVQGGTGFIARSPIYLRIDKERTRGQSLGKYWGIASIVITVDSLFDSVGITRYDNDLEIAIRGKDALGEQGAVFFGDADVFKNDVVLQSVSLPNGSWQIAAIPQGGWHSGLTHLWGYRLIGLLATVITAWLSIMLIRERHHSSHLATHDSLTGLANRRLFEDHLHLAIASSNRSNKAFSLIYCDLNGFKPINDEFGHHAGDFVLKTVAYRMQSVLRQTDTVARIGGDEFMVILIDVDSETVSRPLAKKLLERISAPMVYDDNILSIHASIGVARYPNDADNSVDLIRAADHAMYNAKNNKQNDIMYAHNQ